ncbi:MAG: hypothetical protein R3C58_04245 [Parvularculaceae bacterium]
MAFAARRSAAEAAKTLRADLMPANAAEDPAFLNAWGRLSANALEPNPFFAPHALAPALQAYADEKVRLACVWFGEDLIGLLPVVQKFSMRARLSPIGRRGRILIATSPRRSFAAASDAAFPALFRLLCDGADGRAFLRMGRIARDSAIFTAAEKAARDDRRISYEAGAVSRAMLTGGATAEATLAVHVRQKKRKNCAGCATGLRTWAPSQSVK